VAVANCSGFYGDYPDAAAELLAGPLPIDVLTGDYLAELTMYLLHKARRRDPGAGYAMTFLAQMEAVLGTCLDRGIRVVSNAGGLNPFGLSERLGELADRLGLHPRIAVVHGDDLVDRLDELQASGHRLAHLDTGRTWAEEGCTAVTANAYLGGAAITEALRHNADVVICPRVTDAALVVGPAAWWHGWTDEDVHARAGAVVAGHVIECGAQATGGNYPFDGEFADARFPGFPIVSVAADGSCVVTKQPGTGGAVSVGTVTAQLLYEIASPAYASPDAVARFDTVRIEQLGPDLVGLSGTRGEPPPPDLKMAVTYEGGYRNTVTFVLTGLDVERKADRVLSMLWEVVGGRDRFASVHVDLVRHEHHDAPRNELATALLRVTVKDRDRAVVGRSFANAAVELLLASYAGAFVTAPPSDASAYGVYWPTLVPAGVVHPVVTLPDGRTVAVPVPPTSASDAAARPEEPSPAVTEDMHSPAAPAGTARAGGATAGSAGATVRLPLGALCGARSGDKGGNANVGLWTWDDEIHAWMVDSLSVASFRRLLPEANGLSVERYVLSNLRALNFVVIGLLGEGVASSLRFDAQAKGLGEYVRSRLVEVPAALATRARQTEAG
jgi:hypothetical protein